MSKAWTGQGQIGAVRDGGRISISCRAIFLISTRLQPGESCAEKMETVSTVFRTRSHKAVETAWSRNASTHRAEARC